nr:hypothetical protein CFP56_11715 [Quercus suber]
MIFASPVIPSLLNCFRDSQLYLASELWSIKLVNHDLNGRSAYQHIPDSGQEGQYQIVKARVNSSGVSYVTDCGHEGPGRQFRQAIVSWLAISKYISSRYRTEAIIRRQRKRLLPPLLGEEDRMNESWIVWPCIRNPRCSRWRSGRWHGLYLVPRSQAMTFSGQTSCLLLIEWIRMCLVLGLEFVIFRQCSRIYLKHTTLGLEGCIVENMFVQCYCDATVMKIAAVMLLVPRDHRYHEA